MLQKRCCYWITEYSFKYSDNHNHLDHFPTIDKPSFPFMPDTHISISGVEKLLTKLNIHKATGPDEIPSCIYSQRISFRDSPYCYNHFQQIPNYLPLVVYQSAGTRKTYPPY